MVEHQRVTCFSGEKNLGVESLESCNQSKPAAVGKRCVCVGDNDSNLTPIAGVPNMTTYLWQWLLLF